MEFPWQSFETVVRRTSGAGIYPRRLCAADCWTLLFIVSLLKKWGLKSSLLIPHLSLKWL
jgi:hypothetical protein